LALRSKTIPSEHTIAEAKHSKVQGEATGVFAEKHWKVEDIAAIWNLSKDAVRRMFQNEPGVLILGNHSKASKRRYRTLRIPQSVLERVHKRNSLVAM
jgi:hypothetical protein